mmetsp:Transcript_13302/g.44344  ORF Transcript_13302/g.44344 Transcript_13302/m.44344 type:complete len:95 (-) Transcript_13302:174-458(-)
MYEGYGKAPRIASQVPTVAFLDEARGLVDTAVGAVRYSGAGAAAALPLMITETAAAWASGGPTGACTAFESSLWCLGPPFARFFERRLSAQPEA